MSKNTVVDGISFLVIVLFAYAAFSKIADFENFKVQLGKSPILSPISLYVAWTVPAIELLIAMFLVSKRSQLSALYVSFSLMTMFSAYIVAILKFSDYIPCSCGGILEKMTWTQHLIFNLAFVILITIAILINPSKKTVQ